MPTQNRTARPNFNWHARPANEAIAFVEGVDYLYTPLAARDRRAGPFVYDAYGRHPRTEGAPPPAATGDECGAGPLFQGMRHDPAQEWFSVAPRAFDPTVHPWSKHDPAAYVDGLNLYAAPIVNPINAIKPLGE